VTQEPIRVLVVDDSAVVRGLLARALESDAGIKVVGTAMHGDLALLYLSRNPVDVAVLDVEMPVMDGLTALRRIQAEYPRVRVIMASSLTQSGAQTTVEALALGAAGCIAKPNARNTSESIDQLVGELVPLVKCLANRQPDPVPATVASRPAFKKKTSNSPPHLIAIGSSTGGPNALREVLTALPVDFATPIVIVQHMPPSFTGLLAKHIAKDTRRPCREVVDGEPIARGTTYVAPGDYHVVVDKRDDRMILRLTQDPAEHFCRPSVNPLFRSAAEWYGKSLLSVTLTGMGEDGIEGTRLVAERGGAIIAQDQATSVVWGMPAAVVRENLADQVLPLSMIGRTILRLCTGEMPEPSHASARSNEALVLV
jgi:two-component system chemotaxis response regulator CheB